MTGLLHHGRARAFPSFIASSSGQQTADVVLDPVCAKRYGWFSEASDGLLSVTYSFRNTSTADGGLHGIIAFWLGYGGQIGLCSQLPRARLQTPLRLCRSNKASGWDGLSAHAFETIDANAIALLQHGWRNKTTDGGFTGGNACQSCFRPMPSEWRSTVLAGRGRVQPATVTMGGEKHVAEMMPKYCHQSIQRIVHYRNCCYELTTRSGTAG